MAKKTNFTNHTPEDLARFIGEKREALRNLRFAASGSKNHNVKEARTIRKEIARALTENTARTSSKAMASHGAAK
jgi:ribosomal protein L29